jgi:hypothetical protein
MGRCQCPCMKGGNVSLRSIICGNARSICIATPAVHSFTGSDLGIGDRKSEFGKTHACQTAVGAYSP